jgi:uncharacterized protein
MRNLKSKPMQAQDVLIVIIVGLFAGLLSGLVGVGGGIIIVPALVFFLGFSQKMAQGTSLGLIMLPVGILGVLNYYKHGNVDFKVVGILAIGFVLGSFIGSKISLGLPEGKLKKIFAVLMILIAVKMLFFDKDKEKSASTISKNGGLHNTSGGV